MKRNLFTLAFAVLAACSGATADSIGCEPRHRDAPSSAGWVLHLDDAPGAATADRDGVVVTLDDGAVAAYDPVGETRWRVAVPGAGLDWPAIDGDLVVVPVSPRSAAGAQRAGCVGLDRAAGSTRWFVDAGPGFVATTGVAGDTVVCASEEGRLVAAEHETGAVRWSHDLESELGRGPVQISPRGAVAIAPEHDRLAVVVRLGADWRMSCWHLQTGAEAPCWLDLGSGAAPSAVAAAGSSVFVVGDGASRSVLLADLDTETVRAAVPASASFDPASIPAVADGIAVVVDRLGGVTALDIAGGRAAWRADLGQPVVDARPTITSGVVSIVDWTGRIHTLDMDDGHRAGATDERGGAIGLAADPASSSVYAIRRGLGGSRLEHDARSARAPSRPLQCPAEPGQTTRNEARP